MQKLLIKIYKGCKLLYRQLLGKFSKLYCSVLFYLNDVNVVSFSSLGIPYIHKSIKAKIFVGENFKMNNGVKYSDSGLNGKCRIEVRDKAILTIGNNVGMSDVTITCHEKINIGNNVLIGVGTQIRDTDNHSLNPQDRLIGLDWENKKNASILIEDNVFIGANCFILKGVTIGENTIIGACSVVTKNIPANQIWAGNPAIIIKLIKTS
ncbi:acyltransferase [Arenibacter algicola]|uniref:acyltransferase n=1 Tax=Arenibacter algicola TaxID=616991 RepID=UPI0004DEED9A|nr:acyltransferase [Arenibacter algicola]